jgi:hypothetical protein
MAAYLRGPLHHLLDALPVDLSVRQLVVFHTCSESFVLHKKEQCYDSSFSKIHYRLTLLFHSQVRFIIIIIIIIIIQPLPNSTGSLLLSGREFLGRCTCYIGHRPVDSLHWCLALSSWRGARCAPSRECLSCRRRRTV